MNVCFTIEELALMGAFHPENGRLAMIMTLTEELPFIGEELAQETTRSALAKLHTIRPAASTKVGGAGIRYQIRIGRTSTYLFLEENNWFVEAKDVRAI